jgi:hypothetical protein
MASVMPLLIVWALMAIVMIGYAAYRIASDKPDGSRSHPLFPFASRPTDPATPPKGDYLGWAAYVLTTIGLLGLLVRLGFEVSSITAPEIVVQLSGIASMVGMVLILALYIRWRRNK